MMPVERLVATDPQESIAPFSLRTAAPFINKSISAETRRLYHRTIREFFHFISQQHETLVSPEDVRRWRDHLMTTEEKGGRQLKAHTVRLKLSVVRSFFEYLRAFGRITVNPASTKLVPPPPAPEHLSGRALVPKEARNLLASPDRSTAAGARDYALLLLMCRLSLREAEVAALQVSAISWSHGRPIIKFKVKGGRERVLPLPPEVKEAIHAYLKLDRSRRRIAGTDGGEAYLFQPHSNPRTLDYHKPLSTRMIRKMVRRYAEFAGLGHLSPHDLRRTAITRALDLGCSLREVQMMSGHKDIRTLMRYDHGRENLEQNPVNRLHYED